MTRAVRHSWVKTSFLLSFTLIVVSTMELKTTSVLLLVCVAIIITTSDEAGALPRCCLTVSKRIPPEMLRGVRFFEVQSRSGACDIDALILHIRNKKKICAHPRLMKVLKRNKKIRKPTPA